MIRAIRSLSTAITISILFLVPVLVISCSEDNPVIPDESEPGPMEWVMQNPYYPQGFNLRDVSVMDAMTATAVGSYGTIIRTEDGGETWEEQESGVDVSLVAVSFVTPDIGVAVGGMIRMGDGTLAVLRTIDGGETWTKQVRVAETPYTTYQVDVFFADPDTGVIALNSGKVRLTNDGGSTWIDRKVNEGYIQAMSFCDTHNGLVLESRSVVHCIDSKVVFSDKFFFD